MVWGDLFGRREAREAPAERIDLPTPPGRDDLGASLDRVEAMVAAGAVPSCVTARVERVTHVVRDTIPRLDSLRGSAHGYWVMATATDYLPEAVGGYLRLPRRFADSRPVDQGRTSLMVLVDQLDLLGATMDEVFDAVCRDDAVALVAHGRFLAEKFGHDSGGGELAVDLPVPPPPALSQTPSAQVPPTQVPQAQVPSTQARSATVGPPPSGEPASSEAAGDDPPRPTDEGIAWVYHPGTPSEVVAPNTREEAESASTEAASTEAASPGDVSPGDVSPEGASPGDDPPRLEPPARNSMLDLDDLPGGGAR